MCNVFKSMKEAYFRRFLKKPINSRIKGILCWSGGLVLSALLLSGFYGMAVALVLIISLAYLALALLYRKIVEKMDNTVYENGLYITRQLGNMMKTTVVGFEKASEASIEKVEECYRKTEDVVSQVDDLGAKMDDLRTLLVKNVLPELGIVIQEEEEKEWVQCDLLGEKIPLGLFTYKTKMFMDQLDIVRYADLARLTERELLALKECGPVTALHFITLLDVVGLSLNMRIKCEDGIWYYHRTLPKDEEADTRTTISYERLYGTAMR